MQAAIYTAFPWISVLILLALAGSLTLWLVKPLHKFAKFYALGVSGAVFLLYLVALVVGFSVADAGTLQLAELYSWIPQIGVSIAWGINGISMVMILLATFLVPLVIIAAWNDFSAERVVGYFAWILALEAIMIAIFATRDLFVFYVLFEAMIVPMYFLIGRYGGTGRKRAAMKFLLFSILGGLIMLVGVIAVYAYGAGGEHAYLYDSLWLSSTAFADKQTWLFLSFFIAFAIKAPMWPLHTWLPDTAEQAPAGTSTLLVGVLDKLGTYGMIVICIPLFPMGSLGFQNVIIIFAIISIFWGAAMAIASDNLLRLVSYTSVSHFGFMVIGIFSGSEIALAGAMLYMVAHGVGTAALFFVVDFLAKRGGSYSIKEYGGWQRVTPLLAGTFMIAGLATIALPGLSGFVPEYLVLMGTFKVKNWAALLAVGGVVLAALYILLPYQRIFTGAKPDREVPDLNLREKFVMGTLVVAMLALGFYPAPLLKAVTPIADTLYVMNSQSVLQLSDVTEGNNE